VGGFLPNSPKSCRDVNNCRGQVEIYNPNTNRWSLGKDVPYGASGSISAAVIAHGGTEWVYACGGLDLVAQTNSNSCESPIQPTTLPAKRSMCVVLVFLVFLVFLRAPWASQPRVVLIAERGVAAWDW
jgi:hypothetical protein